MSATPRGMPPAPPIGTVTFVFTDIEGSTVRWERDPEAMKLALRRHDELMRAALSNNDGHIFKTMGDAFCVAFSRPADAVTAILDAQRALAAEDFSPVGGLRVRAAIHTGATDERDGDYFGTTVNRLARLLAIGHGGQVLVSGVTGDLIRGALPDRTSLRDLGEHRLRDLARSERIYQLLAPDLVAEFPPLRSLDMLSNNLPLQLTSFVGRHTEIAEITALIARYRLVTLVGSGGLGKTRASLHVAANLLDASPDGVWFVELVPLSGGEYIPSAVARALEISLPPDGDPLENLTRALESLHVLLVFDNCEHLVEPAARAISAILRGCPLVRILASSRQELHVEGEETYRMPSLEVPAESATTPLTADEAARSTAVTLFVDRARTIDKKFALTDRNAPAVAEICRRLDGIPLAIELSASRIRVFTPMQIRDRLNERFRMLTGGSRDAVPRQQTLRALIDWSYDLLDRREQALFRRVCIFVNGFSIDGVIAVGCGTDVDEPAVLDVLSSLVDKSLVLAEPMDEEVRYRLLESTRAYGLEKLAASGEHPTAAIAHLKHLQAYCERSDHDSFIRARDPSDAIAFELQDVRAALDAANERSAFRDAGELLAAFGRRWVRLGLQREGIQRLETVRALIPREEGSLLGRLAGTLSWLIHDLGFSEPYAYELQMEDLLAARASGDRARLASALSHSMFCVISRGDLAAGRALQSEAMEIPNLEPEQRYDLRFWGAWLDRVLGNLDAAKDAYESLGTVCRSLGATYSAYLCAFHLAEVEHARGETTRAIEIVRGMMPFSRAIRNKQSLVSLLSNYAGYLAAVDDAPGCCAAAREGIMLLSAREPESAWVAQLMEHLALGLVIGARPSRGATLAGYAAPALDGKGFQRETTEIVTYDRLGRLLREALPPGELSRLLADGAALTAQAAIAFALDDA